MYQVWIFSNVKLINRARKNIINWEQLDIEAKRRLIRAKLTFNSGFLILLDQQILPRLVRSWGATPTLLIKLNQGRIFLVCQKEKKSQPTRLFIWMKQLDDDFIILLIWEVFFRPVLSIGFHCSLRDSESSRVWMTFPQEDSSFYFQVFQSLYLSFGDCTERSNYNCYHCHLHVPWFFTSLGRFRYLSPFSLSFSYILLSAGMAISVIRQILFFFFFFLTICRLRCLVVIHLCLEIPKNWVRLIF